MTYAKDRRGVLWAWLLALVLAIGLTACGGETSEVTSGEATEQSDSAAEDGDASEQGDSADGNGDADAEGDGEDVQPKAARGGSPWVNSSEGGNLPVEQPELRDDLYLNTNYDYTADHQLIGGSPLIDASAEIRESVTKLIEDTSKTSPELEQLRIFYNQLADSDARAQTGISEVQPYHDRIMAVTSIDGLNALLASDDFPFVPVIDAFVSTGDMRGNNIVGILPKFVLSNSAGGGAEYYQDTDDESAKLMQQIMLTPEKLKARSAFIMFGANKEGADEAVEKYLAFEGSWGKYGDYTGKWTDKEYGEYGKSNQVLTMEELQERCPNIPVKELLVKLGKDESEAYTVSSPEWLSELDKLWTNDNLDNLKTLVFLSMMKDCYPILDPNLYKDAYEDQKQEVPDAKTSAYEGCNTLGTMSNAIAKLYVDDVLGAEAKNRLTQLTNDMTESYRELFRDTAWMSDAAKQQATEKLDHMTMNILEPDGGYWDYAKLELTPTDKGGTPLSNLLAIKKFRSDRDKELIGQPAKGIGPWGMIRATEMNCFYDPITNSINILPGYVTSAVYSDSMSEQELLAGIGAVIGHEVSHGFDYLGSQYDAYGTPHSVFSGEDAKAFVERRQRLIDYFDTIQVSDGVYVNGTNKSVEGAADLCGVQAILARAEKIDGLDYAKFFQDYARLWCQVYPPGTTLALATDSHPLSYLRTNVNVQMFDEFYDAYGVKDGDGMYLAPESRVVMWGADA